MKKELKEYLDRMSTDIADIKATMGTLATKDELTDAEVRLSGRIDEVGGEVVEVRKDMRKMDRKFTKKFDGILEYVQEVDQMLSDHRKNTEVHNAGLRGA